MAGSRNLISIVIIIKYSSSQILCVGETILLLCYIIILNEWTCVLNVYQTSTMLGRNSIDSSCCEQCWGQEIKMFNSILSKTTSNKINNERDKKSAL